jgi:hypothetical protein
MTGASAPLPGRISHGKAMGSWLTPGYPTPIALIPPSSSRTTRTLRLPLRDISSLFPVTGSTNVPSECSSTAVTAAWSGSRLSIPAKPTRISSSQRRSVEHSYRPPTGHESMIGSGPDAHPARTIAARTSGSLSTRMGGVNEKPECASMTRLFRGQGRIRAAGALPDLPGWVEFDTLRVRVSACPGRHSA